MHGVRATLLFGITLLIALNYVLVRFKSSFGCTSYSLLNIQFLDIEALLKPLLLQLPL